MTAGPPPDGTLLVASVVAFGLAGLACLASLSRVGRVTDPDTRRGLRWLLVTSGGWALSTVGFLLGPTPTVQYGFYLVGLVVGFSTIGPWLYFASAFTGRSFHRKRDYRLAAVALFVLVVAVKLSNPLHGLYFEATVVAEPFPHLAIHSGILHWLIMGLTYALAAVGYFMLLELFDRVDYDTRPFLGLLAITGLPVLFDVAALRTDLLLPLNYEPLGVALFAVGVLFVFLERFQTLQLAGGRDEPVVVLDVDRHVLDYNSQALSLYPDLAGSIGDPLSEALPSVAALAEDDEPVLAREGPDGTRYFRLSTNPFGADATDLGSLLVFSDITHREQYRRELERQNERLDAFASMVSHDLRNPLNVASLRLESARADREDEDLAAAADALDRMEALIDDVLTLARQGQPVDEPEPVDLAAVAGRAWDMVHDDAEGLEVVGDGRFQADPDRLQRLLENLFRNAREHGGGAVTVTVGPLADGRGFFVADDGSGIAPDEREAVFESGYSTDEDGTGFGLAIVRDIAAAHRWDVSVGDSEDGGARFAFTGLEPA